MFQSVRIKAGERLLTLALALSVHSIVRAESGAPGPFAGDARMAVKRTLALRDISIRDLLADMNLATGIRFFAHASVADDRVTVIAHNRALSDSLSAVSSFFGFQWRREGKGPDFAYTLLQPPSSIAKERQNREARMVETAEMIADEVALYDRLEALPLERILERSDAALKELGTATDPERRRALQLEVIVCEQLKASNDWRKLANRFFRTLSHERILAILRGAKEEYTWPNPGAGKELPRDVVEHLQTAGTLGGSSSLPTVGQITFAQLRLSGDSSDEPNIQWHFLLGRGRTNNYVNAEFSSSLPSNSALPDGPAAYLHEPAGWMNDPSLMRPLTFSIISPPGPLSERPTLGQALVEISKTVKIDAVADAFHTTRIAGIRVYGKPIGEALSGLARMTGHRWWKQDDFLMMRSLNFESDRRKEPPSTAVARWIEQCKTRGLEEDEYAEIASLSDAQLATLSRMQIRGEFPDALQPVTNAKSHFRFWNLLTQAQRRRAKSEGLAYSSLTEPQKALYTIAIRDPRASSYGRGRSYSSGNTSTESIATSRMRLIVRENRLWAVKRGDQMRIASNVPKDEALAQLQREDPSIKMNEVRSLMYPVLTFIYESDRGSPITQAWASLPQRWED